MDDGMFFIAIDDTWMTNHATNDHRDPYDYGFISELALAQYAASQSEL